MAGYLAEYCRMKWRMFILFTLLCSAVLFGQGEKESDRTVVEQFKTDYNQEKYASVFELFSPEIKQALPLNKTRAFLGGLKEEAGKLLEYRFLRYEQVTVAVYKADFERGTFTLNIALNADGEINVLFIKPFGEQSVLPVPDRNKTPLMLPFRGEWMVFWGGDTKELNYHVINQAQKNAFDFLVTDANGKSYRNDGKTNEDYYAFGNEILAPCDGVVVLSVDGIKDNIPGKMNAYYVPGNSVVIKTNNDEYLLFAHFKQYSVKVKEGEAVRQGQVLGLCGNSGNSSEAHLHFHIQNTEDMNVATGVKCFFEQLSVNGQKKTDYSPVKNDRVYTES